MQNKIFVIILFCITFYCYGFDIKSQWIDETTYKFLIEDKEFQFREFNTTGGVAPNMILSIDINQKYVLLPGTFRLFSITKFCEKENGNLLFFLECRFSTEEIIGFDYIWKIKMEIVPIESNTCHVVLSGDDMENRHLYGMNRIWYRIDNYPSMLMKIATVNDSRVRLHTEPNLSSDTVALLNKNDKVKLYDCSDNKYEIDGESWYWYHIKTTDKKSGWVYGKYLDIEK